MKYLMQISLVFLFAFPLSLSAMDGLVGKWQMTVPTEDGSTMTVQVEMKSDGTYAVDFGVDGSAEVNGKYILDGDQVTIEDVSGPAACAGGQKGVYKVALDGDSMTMTRISDECENRGGPEGVMAWKRAS